MTKQEFEKDFWTLWFEGQDEKERTKMWLPSKRPHQIPEEFLECLWICSGLKDPLVVEIGTMGGHTKKFWTKLLKATYIGIDSNPNAQADVCGDSGSPQTRDLVRQKTGGRRPNILFVDGNHSPGAVRKDWENWKDVIAPGGFICFHDTHHDHAEYCSGAVKLWQAVQPVWKGLTWDIFYKTDYLPRAQTGQRKQCGIGMLQVPTPPPPPAPPAPVIKPVQGNISKTGNSAKSSRRRKN